MLVHPLPGRLRLFYPRTPFLIDGDSQPTSPQWRHGIPVCAPKMHRFSGLTQVFSFLSEEVSFHHYWMGLFRGLVGFLEAAVGHYFHPFRIEIGDAIYALLTRHSQDEGKEKFQCGLFFGTE
ncbi:hypothetical protein CEXT_757611 [Caerostris extrusa]|uniref:Uncharacterized protein n=1 Tax=Caerostris extrusa TaxID=172846 RepID=A0AAV4YBW6_CAEEX|nr:hypothetical protein CEXT_757611 [Caerostris extrusa]